MHVERVKDILSKYLMKSQMIHYIFSDIYFSPFLYEHYFIVIIFQVSNPLGMEQDLKEQCL